MAIPTRPPVFQVPGDLHPAPFVLKLFNNERALARSVVIASGARYRRLAVENLEAFRILERALLGLAAGGEIMRWAGGGLGWRWQFCRPGGRLFGEPSRQGLAPGARL